ncbi:MAG TPA: cellulose synthase complex periplasmic endoglucanase BcsZ [Trinickia sp.]|uniref:cellulose synthase complex periplasmic endoglucanase BcsZ n=1 Tax=Trinickia sp. TaxID=2571163 RepID=UPI002CC056E9|nr:cellulose synthase complex periplasmic endoglucanase BcsZ [Trinickia sp.]HTI16965.1 cellulose synthase complex periplasmic endoglucanase BcsZ [Trinickia sp.]
MFVVGLLPTGGFAVPALASDAAPDVSSVAAPGVVPVSEASTLRPASPTLVPNTSVAFLPPFVPLAACAVGWPGWERFKHDFISADGRVIDVGSADVRTVSEGQAYALFFALVANDREAFDTILDWTENNLAQGDLTARLPAWLWGRAPNGNWEVLDANAAADADLWMAYALLEAGALWHARSYTARGARLGRRMLDEEAANLQGHGLTLLPGPTGFHPAPDTWRLNPSYTPLQLINGIATRLADDPRWDRLAASTVRMLKQSALQGFAPDWTLYRAGYGFAPDAQTHARGSYDAIRVYLWLGMLDSSNANAKDLLHHFVPFADFIETRHGPPETVDTAAGKAGPNLGNAGFSAAVVPFLSTLGRVALASAQAARVETLNAQTPPGYYTSVLALFGLGWRDGRYRFMADGTLAPAWRISCPAAAH